MTLRKKFLLVFILTLSLFTLVSCGMESYAKKINKKAEKDDHITYSEVVKKLGEDKIVDLTSEIAGVRNGMIIKVKGVETLEDLKEKIASGDKLEGIRITIAFNKAIHAEYTVIDSID